MKKFFTALLYAAIISVMAWVVLFRVLRSCRRFPF